MVKEISSIIELKLIREQKAKLLEHEQYLLMPILNDFSLIPNIYEWFKQTLSESKLLSDKMNTTQRKMFLFIIICLYTPGTLFGDRLPVGLRNILSDIIGCSSDSLSHSIRNLVFIYQQYKDFRENVNHFYFIILKKLNERQ